MRKKHLTTHHRKARCVQGTSDPKNLSKVPENKHRAYHLLFGHGDPFYIARILNKMWIDPDYEIVVIKKNTK